MGISNNIEPTVFENSNFVINYQFQITSLEKTEVQSDQIFDSTGQSDDNSHNTFIDMSI